MRIPGLAGPWTRREDVRLFLPKVRLPVARSLDAAIENGRLLASPTTYEFLGRSAPRRKLSAAIRLTIDSGNRRLRSTVGCRQE